MKGALPTNREECRLMAKGYRFVAGIDEAGRGALMGPVVAGAVIMPDKFTGEWEKSVRDSKMLKAAEREELYNCITAEAVSWGVGVSSNESIDTNGIGKATRLAMIAAVKQLTPSPDYLIIDHFRIPETTIPHHGITHGDAVCFSIACASIIAKVTRDRMVARLGEAYPQYNFGTHKGYGTPEHLNCINKYGPCPLHRRSFAPIRLGNFL